MIRNGTEKKVKILEIVLPFFIYLGFLFFPHIGFALHYNFRTYSVEEGLAQSQVYTVFQDSRGYLWIGTWGGGFSRFDGKTFTNYSTKDGLSDNVVFKIIEDRQGNLWFGTDYGLNKYDRKYFTAYTQKDGLPDDTVWTILEDRNGYLWLGTFSGGISRFDTTDIHNPFTNFTTEEGLADNKVKAITEDQQGNLWIGTTKGVSKIDAQTHTFTQCPVTKQLSNYDIIHILEDRKGNLWFATNEKGICCWNGKIITFFTTQDGLCSNVINSIMEDRQGDLWIATTNGVSHMNQRTAAFTTYTTGEGLSNNDVEWIMEDREGVLWFATSLGVSQFRGKAFSYITTKDGLMDNTVWSIWEVKDEEIWFSTEKGIAKYNKKDSSIETIPDEWGGGIPYSFYKDCQGNLWFGTGKSLIKYNGKSYTNLKNILNVDSINILAIYEDSRGNLWLGSEHHGVTKYNEKTQTIASFTEKKGLLHNTVSTFIEDPMGNIWIGTSGGINIYDGKKQIFTNTTITITEGLTNRLINTILEDKDKNLWIGTYGGGVLKYTFAQSQDILNGTFESFSSKNGLVDDEVLLMIFDNDGNLWIGTNKGVTLLDVEQFNETGKKVFKYYGKEDGFIGIECNQNAVCKDKKGDLWFGTIKGAVRYNPKEDQLNPVEPATHITNVKLFFEEVDLFLYSKNKQDKMKVGSSLLSCLPSDLELPHNKNHLTFEFIGISLTVPEKVRYRVKLEGFDQDWSPAAESNFVTYSNLSPGEYIFKVKACNNSGVWNQEPAVYRFRIDAPFWNTWWFYFLVATSIIGAVFGLVRYRERHLKSLQRKLEEQVRMRTLELQEEKKKVEQINHELEQRVEERTQKLKKAHKQLLHAQKMEAIGTLAAGVAHDLNNVMAGIVSYPELLLLQLPKDSPDESPLRKSILRIQRSGEKAAAIVQDLLTMARRSIEVAEVVNLNHVVSECMKSPELGKILSYHPWVDVENKLDKGLKNMVGSPIHLCKTLMNLVSNAVEAIPEKGNVTIATFNKYLDQPVEGYDEVAAGDYVGLSVSDNGVGMSEKDVIHIFEPFYTKKKMGKSGTGLGMSVVWGTVQDHKGYITLQSEEGKGSTFTLYFPATQLEEKKSDTQTTLQNLLGNGESILVVDDVEDQRDITSLMLKKLGYSVQAVSSGEAAVEYVEKNPVDLLVLDMIMDPGISGLETYKRILKLYPQQKTVIISGYTETEEVKEAQRLGAGTYVKKPFGMKDIGKAIKDELTKINY
jgi:ligand-binding sensor domain-containing protein/signal transduction histidine kinase/CheY-like chemotaxis protein